MTNKQFQTNHARSSGKTSQQQLCKYKFGSDAVVVSVYRSLSRQTQFTIKNFHSDGIFYSTAFPMWLISDLIPIGFFDVYRTLVHTYHRQTLAKNSWTKHLNMLFVSEFISVWCQRSIASSTLTFEMFRALVHSIRICSYRLSQTVQWSSSQNGNSTRYVCFFVLLLTSAWFICAGADLDTTATVNVRSRAKNMWFAVFLSIFTFNLYRSLGYWLC